MSTINAANYGDGSSSVPASAVLEGTAKAHLDYTQVTPSIAKSYNISSVTDNGTGDHSPQYTNNFDSGNYATTTNPAANGTNADLYQTGHVNAATGSIQFYSKFTTDNTSTQIAVTDLSTNHYAWFGDLA